MIIAVTQAHITAGRRNDCTLCPLALAFHAAGLNVSVCPSHVDVYRSCNPIAEFTGRIGLPIAARNFVMAFDSGAPVLPFEFEIPNLQSDESVPVV